MTFTQLEQIRKSKGLRNWQFAYLLGLRPRGEIKTPIPKYCGPAYRELKTGKRNIDVEIIAAAERIEKMTAAEIVKELSEIK